MPGLLYAIAMVFGLRTFNFSCVKLNRTAIRFLLLPSVFDRRGIIFQLPARYEHRELALRLGLVPAEATSANAASARIDRTESGAKC